MKKLRIGVVGTGYLGKFHAEKYAQMDEVDLVGVVDIDRAQAKKVAKTVNAGIYMNHKDFFGKIDAASVVVPTPAHFVVAKDLLEHDIDVLIEKPITTTVEDADELIAISESRGLIIQVGHLERFNPAVVALHDIVTQPMFLESHRLSIYQERCTDVSVVLDLMIHDIDIILNFVQSDIMDIRASGISVVSDHVDIANARLEFINGCVANVTASRISTRNERKIRLFQKDAYLSVDFANHEVTVIKRNGNKDIGPIPGMGIQRFCFTKSDALKDELTSFVKAVTKRSFPEVTGRMGRDALKIALSVMEQISDTNRRFFA